MKSLKLGRGLTLPVSVVTQTFAILAKRGVGKSYTASVMAEEMLESKQPIIALDPTGAWWGLRSHYPVVVFGGEHGDLPLEESAGEEIASAIVEDRFPAVIDLSLMRKGAALRFMVGFAETLYRLNREPVHLFVDEADMVAPQTKLYGGDENRVLGAMEDIVRRGRKRGIGCTLITQRPAVLNKNVLTQCECLVALRLVHHRDIDAIKEWVSVHGDPTVAKDMIASLPSLPVGEAWFWAPAWDDLFQRVEIRKRKTFDSGATPKPGEKPAAIPSLKSVDLEAIGNRIKAAAQAAKANDPRALKAEILRLQKELEARRAPVVTPPPRVERVEVPAISPELVDELRGCITKIDNAIRDARSLAGKPVAAPRLSPVPPPAPPPLRPALKPIPVGEAESLPKAQRLILTALAQHGGSTKSRIAVLCHYAVNSGSFSNAISWLRTRGMIYSRGDRFEISLDGLEALGSYDPMPSGDALIEHWIRDLPKAESSILRVVREHHPRALTKAEIAQFTGYAADSGSFSNALSKLRTLELIEGRQEIQLSPNLRE